MTVKEYTRIVKNEIIIFRKKGFHDLKEMKERLCPNKKYRHRIEYIFTNRGKIYIAASFMFHGKIKVAMVFPYWSCQNNKK
jgi:hypothetical protein